MGKLSFNETVKRFDLIVSDMNDVDEKNNTMFRRVCKEIFQSSYSKLTVHNNLHTGINMAGVGIVSAIKLARGKYKKGSFTKSINKLNHQTNVPTYSDLKKINHFLEISEFSFVVKLLKIQYNHGLIGTISFITLR